MPSFFHSLLYLGFLQTSALQMEVFKKMNGKKISLFISSDEIK